MANFIAGWEFFFSYTGHSSCSKFHISHQHVYSQGKGLLSSWRLSCHSNKKQWGKLWEATRGQEKGSWLWKLWSWESLVPLWVPRTPVAEEPHDLAGQEGTKLHGRANTLLTNSLTLCLIGVKDKGNGSHRQARVQRCGFSRAKLTQALTAWPYVPSSKSKLRRFWLSCKPHGYPSKTAQYLVPHVYQETKSPLALRELGHRSVDRDQDLLTFSPSLSWDGFCSNTASTAQ